MVIRRIREHVTTHNWFAVLIDLIIVVIGVFIGLQVSNWNATRIERAEARAYRAQIIEDLMANEQEIAERRHYYRQVRAHALAAMEAFEDRAPRADAFLVSSFQATQISPIRMERSAYDEMIASGMAKRLGDPSVRRRLSSYYAGTNRFEDGSASSTAYRERLRRAMTFAVQRRIRERCGDIIAMSPDGIEALTLPERCSLQLPSALVSRAASDLRNTPELEQDLARHIDDLDIKLVRFDRWLRLARDTRQSLERLEMS